MKKEFDFGKIDYNNNGKKTNKVTINIELNNTSRGPEFSETIVIWKENPTDFIRSSRDFEELERFIPNHPVIKELSYLLKYHLNSLHAGTEKQEELLKKHFEDTWQYNYTECRKYLKQNGLLIDKLPDGRDYEYGSGWILKEIPAADLKRIKKLFDLSSKQ